MLLKLLIFVSLRQKATLTDLSRENYSPCVLNRRGRLEQKAVDTIFNFLLRILDLPSAYLSRVNANPPLGSER
jgi:hypothetical protein